MPRPFPATQAPEEPAPKKTRKFQPPLLPWAIALLVVVLVHAVSLWWVPQLHLNNAPDLYYPPGSKAVEIRDALRKEFPSDELLTVVFQGPDLYGHRFLERIDQLSKALEKEPLVDRVSTLTNVEHIKGSEDGFSVAPLIDAKRLQGSDAETLKQRVLSDRFIPGLLASRDGSTVALAVRPKKLEGSAERLQLKLAVVAAINQVGLQNHFAGDAGPISVDVAQLLSMMSDTVTFVPLTVALGLLLLAWVVGRLVPVLIGGLAMSTVTLPVIAGIAVSGQPYSMATAILPSLLAAYTLATLMHLYAGIQRSHAEGARQRESIRNALSETMRPGAFNVMTTSAGLLSLLLVPMPPIQTFGVAGAAGTAMVFIVVYFIVPPLLVRFDRRRWPVKQSTLGLFARIANRLCIWSMRRPKLAVGATLTLVGLCIPLAMNVRVETDVLKFFGPDHPVNTATNLVETKLSGVTSLELLLETPARDGLVQPEKLQAIKELQNWLAAQPEVDRVTSHADLIEQMHWAMNNEQIAFRSIPPDADLISQYLLIYDGNDLYELVDREFLRGRIMVNMSIHGASEIKSSIERIQARLEEAPLPGITVQIGGYGRLFADQVDLLISGQIDSFLGAFGMIFLLMMLLWRSPSGALLCMIPNLMPLFFVFVLMGSFDINLDMATVMIAGVVLGITVDDTIHLYHGYNEKKRAGVSIPLALSRSFRNSGRAVLATSLLLTAQFALLSASDFVPTSNFGLMTAVGLLAGQAAELLLLPALLILKDGKHPASRAPVEGPAPLVRRKESVMGSARSSLSQPSSAVPEEQRRRDLPALLICRGDTCRSRGGDAIWRACVDARAQAQGSHAALMPVLVETACLGRCDSAPAVAWCPQARPLGQTEHLSTLRQAVACMTSRRGDKARNTEALGRS